ncbi:MAG TPA: GYD domain-containing protein [Vicinamibacteria bacterium]|jgi:uncharacterized protein with GYD domain
MPLYMTQFAYTPEAWAALAKSPEDRTEALRGLAKKMGGKVVNLYYSFGEYDGVAIFEAPDDVSAAAVAVAASGAGHVKGTKTTRLLTAQEAVEVMRKAGSAAYKGPVSKP